MSEGPGKVSHLAVAATKMQDPVAIVECRQMKGPAGTQWVFTIKWNDHHTTEEAVRSGLRTWLKS